MSRPFPPSGTPAYAGTNHKAFGSNAPTPKRGSWFPRVALGRWGPVGGLNERCGKIARRVNSRTRSPIVKAAAKLKVEKLIRRIKKRPPAPSVKRRLATQK